MLFSASLGECHLTFVLQDIAVVDTMVTTKVKVVGTSACAEQHLMT